MPYGGWTLPQFEMHLERATRHMSRLRRDAAGLMNFSIGAAFDKDAAKKLRKFVEGKTP